MNVQDYWKDVKATMAARHTDEAALMDAPTPCPMCGGLGVVRYNLPVEHPGFGKLHPCPDAACEQGRDARQRRAESRFKTAGLPSVYRAFTFATWDALTPAEHAGKEIAAAACKAFAQHPKHEVTLADICRELGVTYDGDLFTRNSLMLHGDVGRGKTGLVAAIVNDLIERGREVLYIRCRDLLQEIQSRYGKDEYPKPEDVLERFQKAPLLVIDEFNLIDYTADRKDRIESVMRHRHAHRLPTLMTANIDQTQFEAAWGERTADVVRHMAWWIQVGGAKLRRIDASLKD
jgi:DNA replication protein DnaC